MKDKDKHFNRVLDNQQKVLNQKHSKLPDLYHKFSKTRLIDHLRHEEGLFSEYLDLYTARSREMLELHYKKDKKCRHIDTIKQYVLGTSAAITIAPLGPLEILSLPFWGMYFSIEELERLSGDFNDWRKITRTRVFRED